MCHSTFRRALVALVVLSPPARVRITTACDNKEHVDLQSKHSAMCKATVTVLCSHLISNYTLQTAQL